MSKKPLPPSDLADKFMLRMPDGMRDRLKASAEKNNRSMNAEIVGALQRYLEEEQELLELSGMRPAEIMQKNMERMNESLEVMRRFIEKVSVKG